MITSATAPPLFAALDIATGAVFTECKHRHRHQELLSFVRHLDESAPSQLDLHLIVDNYATHKHPSVRTWLAQRPRYRMHCIPPTPLGSTRSNVGNVGSVPSQRTIRRGTFTSVQDLIQKIDSFVRHYNRSSQPFVWTATADSILQKIARLCSRISGTPHLVCTARCHLSSPKLPRPSLSQRDLVHATIRQSAKVGEKWCEFKRHLFAYCCQSDGLALRQVDLIGPGI